MKAQAVYTSAAFVEYLRGLSNPTPIADAFGDRATLAKDYPAENQHGVQKKHIVSWFGSKGNESAQTVYNRLLDPAMLLWIAESVDVDGAVIEQAISEAGATRDSSRAGSQAAMIRKHLTWAIIFAHIGIEGDDR